MSHTQGSEQILPNTASEQAVNVQLAQRYNAPESDRRAPFQQSIEESLARTAKREIALVSTIEEELKEHHVPISPDAQTSPQQFMDFLFSNGDIVSGITPSERDRYSIGEDYQLLYNEAAPGKRPFYVLIHSDQAEACRYLLLRGVDLTRIDRQLFETLMKGKTVGAVRDLAEAISEGQFEVKNILFEERSTYAQDLQNDLSGLTERIQAGTVTAEMMSELARIFEFYGKIPARHSEESMSLVPWFEGLIRAKQQLPGTEKKLVNDFLEQHEESIFEALGEEYFQTILDRRGEFEGAYREMFGYTNAEIWQRRDRNWAEVNTYIKDTIKARGNISVEDCRQIHTLSSKGVLPFFCYGFRSDRNINWFGSERSKRTVIIGSKQGGTVRTTDYSEIESSLSALMDKANRIVGGRGISPLFTEVALANLFAEYASIHPHPDGNGTSALFFVEALKSLRDGTYQPPESYEQNYMKRLTKSFNHNPVALAVAATKMRAYELKHQVTSPS